MPSIRRRRFYRIKILLIVCAGLITVAACAPLPAVASADIEPDAGTVTIYVASNGWHTAIVLARPDHLSGAIPETADFPKADYFAFGWGDAEYFPARDPSFATTLSAALLPTPAVLHMSGLTRHPRDVYPHGEIIALKIRERGFRRLVGYLGETFDRNGSDRARAIGPGLNAFSRFYPAKGSFHLFNTCNSWTARALLAAGLPVKTEGTVDAESLMAQLREISVNAEPAENSAVP